jgi:hypothetical protein
MPIFLLVMQSGIVFCETQTIDLSNENVISIYLSPIDVNGTSNDDTFIIGEKFTMHITADIIDPKVRAEIKDGTLEWRLKSITFYYYVPNEDRTSVERIKEATFTDNNTLKNNPYHPITVSRPIGQWGSCAKWQIVKSSANPNDESSTFNSPGAWDVEFDIEFRGEHKDINDCMIQANLSKQKAFNLEHYLGMIVDNYAVEGSDDVINVQFGVVNKEMKSETRIVDARHFKGFFQINWTTDNDTGLVENDFIRIVPNNSLSIFRSKNENDVDIINSNVKRYNNTTNQYSIEIDRNFMGNENKTVTANFILKAGIGPNTETKLIENANISIMNFPYGPIGSSSHIKYYVIPKDVQENLGTEGNPKGTEGRYLVKASELNVLKTTTLFGGKNDATVTGINNGKPDTPADNGININDIIQGGTGDCYLHVCLMALAKNNKNFIRTHLTEGVNNQQKMYYANIYDKNNNAYTLGFRVDNLLTHGVSQAKLSGDYDDSINQKRIEVWPQVYEKTWAKIRENANTFGDITGGNPGEPWKRITGKNSTTISLINYSNEQIWNEIVSITNNANYYLIAGTKKTITPNESLYDKDQEGNPINLPIGSHVYFVDGFIDDVDISKKKVVLLNPHGENDVKLPFSELSKILNAIIILNKP